jgi:hypothetical protein
MSHSVYLTDGSFDWSGGVDSNKPSTVQSEVTPNGLRRDQLAWMTNATVRSGGILQRTGWIPNGITYDNTGLYQGGFMYEPRDGSNPYLVLSISGNIIRYDIDTAVVTNLSNIFGLQNPAAVDQAFFVQGEEFLVIQAGDGVTLPLIWDGAILRRSIGIIGPNNIPGPYPLHAPYNEIPAAGAMDYYKGRIWYAQGRTFGACDIVQSFASGSVAYGYRDSVIKVTENPLCVGGDNFTVPSNSGNIRAIKHSANVNALLGEGDLFISTRKAIYTLTVPINRSDWIKADTDNVPLMKIAQLNNGWVNDRSVVAVNGDLFGQSLEPSIRSLRTAVRNFNEWGNVPISTAESRALQFNNRALMRFSTGIEFNNRLLEAVLPRQLPQGVVHDGILPLSFETISTLEKQLAPAWEGMYEGLPILQLFTGDFGGLDRAFAVIVSPTDSQIAVWELTTSSRTDNQDSRVIWNFELPAFTFSKEFELKRLAGGEVWISKVFGTVKFLFEYRTDSDPCWRYWHESEICVARNCEEDQKQLSCYPYPGQEVYREGYKWPIVLPKPPVACNSMGERPTDIGYQFQVRVTVQGWAQVRGVLLYATPFDKALYGGLKCG